MSSPTRSSYTHSASFANATMDAFAMTNATNPNTEISFSIVDDDSKRLAIIYGTLGTMLALASLAFAALTWARSRRQQCELNRGTRPSTDRSLESNEYASDAGEAFELAGTLVASSFVAGSWFVVPES